MASASLNSPDNAMSAVGEAISASIVFSALAGGSAECLADSSLDDKTSWVPVQCPRPGVCQCCPNLSDTKSDQSVAEMQGPECPTCTDTDLMF